MNIWDLKRVNEVFQTENKKVQGEKKQKWQGFSYFNTNCNKNLRSIWSSSIKNNHSNPPSTNQETLDFKDFTNINTKALLKNSIRTGDLEDQQWNEKISKNNPNLSRNSKTKNLKCIASTVYQHLRKYACASYSDLSQELYSDNFETEDREENKNIRRRLYDAVNVMISANVLSKNKNIIEFNEEYALRTINDAKFEDEMIRQKIKEKTSQIKWKRKYIQHLQAVESVLAQFYTSRLRENIDQQGNHKLMLPIIAVRSDDIQIREQTPTSVVIYSGGEQIKTQTEMQLLARLFPSQKTQCLFQEK